LIQHSRSPTETQLVFIPAPEIFTDFESTNSGVIVISGKTFDTGLLKVFLNDAEVKKIDVNAGDFFSTEFNINEGQNKIFAVVQDSTNKVSPSSNILNVFYDKTQPSLEINSPQDNAKFSGSSQKNIMIEGKTDEDNFVYINNHPAVIKKDGQFTLTYELNEGENLIKIVAQNKAGNQTEKDLTIYFNP